MARFKPVNVQLDADQRVEADAIYQRLRTAFDAEARRVAELMASKATNQIFGATEFELRDRLHALGAETLEAVAQERVKKGRLSWS